VLFRAGLLTDLSPQTPSHEFDSQWLAMHVQVYARITAAGTVADFHGPFETVRLPFEKQDKDRDLGEK